MHRRPLAILYAGPGIAGRGTSVRFLAGRGSSPYSADDWAQLFWPVAWSRRDERLPLRLSAGWGRSVYYFESLKQGIERLTGVQRDRFEREVEFLRTVDGIVFVTDSQIPMEVPNLEFLDRTRRELIEVGRDPDQVPIVFQLNKRCGR